MQSYSLCEKGEREREWEEKKQKENLYTISTKFFSSGYDKLDSWFKTFPLILTKPPFPVNFNELDTKLRIIYDNLCESEHIFTYWF